MRIFKFLFIVAIFFFLGVGVWRMADLGYFRQWERLTNPPKDKTEYLTIPAHLSPQNPVKFTKPCDYSQPEFTFFARPPAGIVDCLQRSDLYADGYGRTTYVLDSAGNVWIWEYTLTAYTTLARMICWPGVALIIGLVVAVIANAS